MRKYKIGDTVKTINKNNPRYNGLTGIITDCVEVCTTTYFRVNAGKEIEEECAEDGGLWFEENNLLPANNTDYRR